MIERLEAFDQELFLYLNAQHDPLMDVVMEWISWPAAWILLYAILLYAIVQKKGPKALLLALPIIALAVGATDLIHLHGFKNVFMRYRPCHNLDLQGMVHIVNDHCGGKYGFVSGHSANSFAIATIVSIMLEKRWIRIALLSWAATVAYSRVYLGVHYPADITCGAILGVTVSMLVALLYFRLDARFFPEDNKAAPPDHATG